MMEQLTEHEQEILYKVCTCFGYTAKDSRENDTLIKLAYYNLVRYNKSAKYYNHTAKGYSLFLQQKAALVELEPAASKNNNANFDDAYHGTVEGFALNSAFGAIESEMQKQIDDLQAQLDAVSAEVVTLTARNQQLQGDLQAAQAIIVNAGKQTEALRRAANDVYQLEGSTDPAEIEQRHEALMFLVNGLQS